MLHVVEGQLAVEAAHGINGVPDRDDLKVHSGVVHARSGAPRLALGIKVLDGVQHRLSVASTHGVYFIWKSWTRKRMWIVTNRLLQIYLRVFWQQILWLNLQTVDIKYDWTVGENNYNNRIDQADETAFEFLHITKEENREQGWSMSSPQTLITIYKKKCGPSQYHNIWKTASEISYLPAITTVCLWFVTRTVSSISELGKYSS